jgi:PTH1 family peptidyl-tRNA hydrolase
MKLKGKTLLLLKPSTYMNLSGYAVRYWIQKEKITLENLLVVVDDLALPFGTLRFKPQGSDAGHNGLKHIQTTLDTQVYSRLRFGIGNQFFPGGPVDLVLSNFSTEETTLLPQRIQLATDIIQSFCLSGIEYTMNHYNNK